MWVDIEQTITSIKPVMIFSMKTVCSTSVRPVDHLEFSRFKIQDPKISTFLKLV
eukprot:SAG11_NODE_4202_length_2016_cov_38.138237_1_plen_53_part_10